MANYGLFIGFGYPVRGREQAATRVFNEFVQYLTAQQQAGTIAGCEPVFLQPHGGVGYPSATGRWASRTIRQGGQTLAKVRPQAGVR